MEGDFGNVHGHATKEFSNGTKYVGQFANDEMHGAGKMYDKDGVLVRDGKWMANRSTCSPRQRRRERATYADHARLHPTVSTTALPCRYLNSVLSQCFA